MTNNNDYDWALISIIIIIMLYIYIYNVDDYRDIYSSTRVGLNSLAKK